MRRGSFSLFPPPVRPEAGGKILLASHLEGQREKGSEIQLISGCGGTVPAPGENVALAGDCIGAEVENQVRGMRGGDVLLLENLRFHAEEEKNDEAFSRALASLCDVYVNDAFGTAHRAHASTEGMTHFVRTVAAGFLMIQEIRSLEKALVNPEQPYVAILGGAKVSDKIGVIQNLLDKVARSLSERDGLYVSQNSGD